MSLSLAPSPEAAEILSRVIRPEKGDLTTAGAESLLGLAFSSGDQERLCELAELNQNDELKESDRRELESFLQIGLMIDLLHAKARLTLAQQKNRRS